MIQSVFAIIVLSLAAALVDNQPSEGDGSHVIFCLVVGVFSIITWVYTLKHLWWGGMVGNTIVLVLDLLNLMMYGGSGIEMIANNVLSHSCGNTDFISSNKVIGGSTQRCYEAQTVTVFLWFGITPSPS